VSGAARRSSLERYRSSLQRALSCVTSGVLVTQTPRLRAVGDAFEAYSLVLNGGDAISRVAASAVYMRVQHQFRLSAVADASGVQEWRALAAGYFYVLQAADGSELTAFHWHAASVGNVGFPHLHIGVGATGAQTPFLTGRLHKAHFPTGLIDVEDIVRFAIVEFGARPRRPDWESVLDATRRMRADA
jgi:hypothetical protein